MPISQPFAIGTEGPTIDGRNISRDAIIQMAKAYDPKVYTAVINMEHYLSAAPDSVFSSYGKVVSLSTQETEILGEKKLQLMAVADVSQEAVDMQKKGKKAFSSMEVQPNFIGKGIAYLTGMAFTDTPASVGTEPMKFSAFSSGSKENVYSFAAELDITFADEEKTAPSGKEGETLLSKVKDLIGLGKKDADTRFSDQAEAITAVAQSQKDLIDRFAANEKASTDTAAALKKIGDDFAAIKGQLEKLENDFNTKPDGAPTRPQATGGDAQQKTDC